jgi:acyl carrier protein
MIDKLRKIISENTFIDLQVLESLGADDLLTQIGLDSINIIYVIGEIEEQFEFNFTDEDLLLEKFETFNKIMDLIKKYTRQHV